MLILRKLQAVILVFAAVLVLALPAAASMSHGVAHLGAPVADRQHHHHDEDGVGDAHDEADRDQQDNQRDTKGFGHSHPPTQMADPATIDGLGVNLSPFFRDLPQEWSIGELDTLSWSPHRRPPRTA